MGREVELDPRPRRDHGQGGGAGLRNLGSFRFGLFLNSSATDIVFVTLPSTAVETAIAQCTSRWAMARGHRLNNSIVLAAVHGLSGLFRAVSAVEPSLFRPLPPPPPTPVPVPNKHPRFCGRKAKCSRSGNCCGTSPFLSSSCPHVYHISALRETCRESHAYREEAGGMSGGRSK